MAKINRFCIIDRDQQLKIVNNLIIRLEKVMRDREKDPGTGELKPFDLKSFVTTFYEDMLRSTNGNVQKSIILTQMVPNALDGAIGYMKLKGKKAQVNNLVTNFNLSLDKIGELATEFSQNLENVAAYVTLDEAQRQAAFNKEERINPPKKIGRPTKAAKDIINLENILDELEKEDKFRALALNFNTTQPNESLEKKKGEYTNLRDPSKAFMYDILKMINARFRPTQNEPTASTLNIGGHIGFRLALRFQEEGTYFGAGYTLTISDNEGNPIMFNSDGTINKEGGGKAVAFPLRRFNQDKYNKLLEDVNSHIAARVHGNPKITNPKAEIKRLQQQFKERYDYQVASTEYLINKIGTDTSKKILLEITGGSSGYFDTNGYRTPMSSVFDKLTEEEIKSIHVVPATGFPAINIEGVNNAVGIRGVSVGLVQVSEIKANIADILTKDLTDDGDPVTADDKIKYVKQFINVASGASLQMGEAEGKLFVSVQGTPLDLTDREAVLKALDNLYIHMDLTTLQRGTYEWFNIGDKGRIKREQKPYDNFLKNFFNIDAIPNAEGRIVALNGYFKWEPTSSVIKVMKEETKAKYEDEKAEELAKRASERNPNEEKGLNISKLIAETATPEQIKAAEEWWKNHPLSKLIKLRVLQNVANSDSWGRWTTAGITLFKGSDYSHMYHEAWHAFSQLFLTKEEKEKLYAEAAKNSGTFKVAQKDYTDLDENGNPKVKIKNVEFSKASKPELEEYIAEEFRKFALKGGKVAPAKPAQKSIFKKVWEILKYIFTGVREADMINPDSVEGIQEIFDKLFVGNINQYSPSLKNVLFDTANMGVVGATDPEKQLSFSQAMLSVKSIDGLLAQEIAKQGPKANVSAFSTTAKRKEIFDSIKASLDKKRQALVKEIEAGVADTAADEKELQLKGVYEYILNFTLTEWGSATEFTEGNFLPFFLKHSQFKDLLEKPVKQEAEETDTAEGQAERAQALRNHDTKGNEVSNKDVADPLVLYLTRTLLEVDSQGNIALNEMGFPKLANFQNVWNSLSRNVSGQTTLPNLYNRLVDLAPTNRIYQQIINRLGDPAQAVGKQDEMDMWLKFLAVMNMPRVALMEFVVEKQKDEKSQRESTTFRVGRSSADYFKVIQKWSSDFMSSSEQSPYIKRDRVKGEQNVNYLDTQAIVDRFITIKKEKAYGKEKPIYVLKDDNDAINFFQAIGINLSANNAVLAFLKDDKKAPLIKHAFVEKIALANNLDTLIKDPIEFFRKAQKEGGKRDYTNTRENLPDLDGFLRELADIEAEYSDEYSTLSRMTASGDKQHEQTLNSSATVIVDGLNTADRIQDFTSNEDFQHMEYLDPVRNPWAKSSKILNSLYVLDTDPSDASWGKRRNNSLVMNNLSGARMINLDYTHHGVSHSGMTLADKFLTDFHSILSGGLFNTAQHGSKSSYFAMYPEWINTYSGKKTKSLYVDTGDFYNTEKGMQEAFRVVRGYLQAEIERIAVVKANPEYYKRFKTMENAENFSLFADNILSDDLKSKLLNPKFIEAMRKDGIGTALADFGYMAELKTGFNQYFNRLAQDYTNNLLSRTAYSYTVVVPAKTDKGKTIYKRERRYAGDGIQKKIYENILAERGFPVNQINQMLAQEEVIDNNGKKHYIYKNPETIQELKKTAMLSFAVNSWIHLTEMQILVYGDLTQYNHEKDEFNKRNSTFFSTGYLFASDHIAASYINSLTNTEGKSTFGRDYTYSRGFKTRKYDGTLNTAVIGDNVVPSLWYTDLVKLFSDDLAKRIKDKKEINKVLFGFDKSGVGTVDKPKKNGLMKAYKEMTEGDGQGWITMDAYRILKKAESKWTDSQEEVYQKIIKGEVLSPSELAEMFPVYKVQYAGALKQDKTDTKNALLPINAIHKFSLMPLIPTVLQDTALKDLHDMLMEKEIDYALFESGSKLSTLTSKETPGETDKIFKEGDTSVIDKTAKLTINKIYTKYLKNQLDLGNNFKGTTIFSTQLRKILTGGLMENGVPLDFMPKSKNKAERRAKWEKLPLSKKIDQSPFYRMARNFESNIAKAIEVEKNKLLKEIGWSWTTKDWKTRRPIGSMKPLIDFIKKEMLKQDFAEHEINYLDVNAEGEVVRTLDGSLSREKIERLLMSIVNNRLVKQHLKGEALVQFAVSFTGGTKFKLPTEEQKTKYGTGGLPFYNWKDKGPTNACKIKIALQGDFQNLFQTSYLKKNEEGVYEKAGKIAVYNNEGDLDFDASLKRLNEMVKLDEWLDVDNNRKKVTVTGVRIPVQGKNSMEFMEVFEFLPPAAGNIIILPSEIVAKSGGDFDVDKLTSYFPSISRSGTWLNGEEFGEDYETAIQAEMDLIKNKLDERYSKLIGKDFKISGIKKALKGQISERKEAIKVLKAQRNSAFEEFDILIDELIEYTRDKRKELPKDLSRALKKHDSKAIMNTLKEYEKLGVIKDFDKTVQDLYRDIKALELDKLSELIDEAFANKKELFEAKSDSELDKLSVRYSDLKQMKRKFKDAVTNNIIDNMVTILSHKHNRVDLLTPNSTNIAKPIAEEMEKHVEFFNFKNSRRIGGQNASKGVYGSRASEYDFNLKKHQDNMLGKDALGIFAIDNSYTSLFNNAGAYLNPSFITQEGDEIPTQVYLRHNTTEIYYEGDKMMPLEVISLASLRDVNGMNLIQEIDSQLINGTVDVEKDAWVAFVQGNKEAAPMFGFLNKMGTPIEDIVNFLSNPLIRMYNEEKKALKGALGDIMGKPYQEGRIQKRARGYVWDILLDKFTLPNRLPGTDKIRDLMIEHSGGGLLLGPESLEAVAKDKDVFTGGSLAGFLHYMYLEELANSYNDIKSKTNVDTSKTASLFDAYAKSADVESLKDLKYIPDFVVDYIKNLSPIAGFFVQDFTMDLYKDLFPITNSDPVNEYLLKKLRDPMTRRNLETATGYDPEVFAREFRKWLIPYIFINHVKEFDAGSSTYYKGARVQKDIPVKYAEGITRAAFVRRETMPSKAKQNTIYVNINQIEKEFMLGLYREDATGTDSYISQGLAPVDFGAFDLTANGQKAYQNFVIEREYLRNLFPMDIAKRKTEFQNKLNLLTETLYVKETESDEEFTERVTKVAYEQFLRDKALDNTMNTWKIFKSGEKTFAKQIMNVLKKYPHLSKTYSILEQFASRALKKNQKISSNHLNLVLRDARDLDKNTVEQYYLDIKDLSEKKDLLPANTPNLEEETNYINNLFRALPFYAFLQGGLNSGRDTAYADIMPYDQYTKVISEALDSFSTRDISSEFLGDYMEVFLKNHQKTNKPEILAGQSWESANTPDELKFERELLPNLFSTPYTDPKTKMTTDYNPFISRTSVPGVFVLRKEVVVNGEKRTLDNETVMKMGRLAAAHDNTYFVVNEPFIRATLPKEGQDTYISTYYQGTSTMFLTALGENTGKGIRSTLGKARKEYLEAQKEELQKIDPKNFSMDLYKDIFPTTNKVRELVDNDIRVLEEALASGKKLVFLEEGYAQDLIAESNMNSPEMVTSQGVEISSNSKGLAGALTNPTELAKSKGNISQSYPIVYKGNTYRDVEEAYQKLKDKSEASTKPALENSNNYKLMVNLIAVKLKTYPQLTNEITNKGGSAWILSSTHQPTNANTIWETGGENWFIRALNEAYLFNQQQAPVTNKVEVEANYYTPELLRANPNKIYVFGDNNQRQGKKGQAAIRDEVNAMGISTKLRPSADEDAFMTDKDLVSNKTVIDSDIAKIKATGKIVVFPKDGLGTGLAALKTKAPQTYAYLKERLLQEFGFNNDTGTISSKASVTTTNPSEYSNFSGGADKYDKYWDAEGRKAGVTKHTHYTTEIYDALATEHKEELSRQYLDAAKFLGRGILAESTLGGKLVRRDMMQANKADAVFAITELVKPGVKGRKGYVNKMTYSIPEGGTGYAVARAILSGKPAYVFNQSDKYGNPVGWYKWDSSVKDFVATDIPVLTKNYAGIGSHTSETAAGMQAIKDVYRKTFKTAPAQVSKAKFKGQMKFSYGKNARPGLVSKSTFEAIKRGERTATTRYESQENLDYWKQPKVGDIIEWESATGETLLTRVTKPLHKLRGSGKTPTQWTMLEGWSREYFNKNVMPRIDEAWQIEFEYVEPQKQAPATIQNPIPKQEFFVYLSEQLAQKFGYVNPGSEPVPTIKDILAKRQGISQDDIDNALNKCK